MTDNNFIIYLVDDDISIGRSIGRLLKSWDYSYRIFTSAESFLEGANKNDVSCLILDIMLQGMDGVELQQRLKHSKCNIPIIFITAYGDEEMEKQLMDAGAYGYLDKPFDERLLRSMIDEIFKSRSSC